MTDTRTLTAFRGPVRIAAGPIGDVALAIKHALAARPDEPALAYDDATGAFIDFDLSGDDSDILARLAPAEAPPQQAQKVGRPKLGVVAREVTLLPRHWDWLRQQPGGASATLRQLVETAIRSPSPADRARMAKTAADRFMTAALGDQPGYEDAARALYAGDEAAFAARIAPWPKDLRDYAARLAAPAFEGSDAKGAH